MPFEKGVSNPRWNGGLLLDAKERFEWVIRHIDMALEQNREVNKNLDIRRIA